MKLPAPLPTIGDILKIYNLQAKQQLSQNFILNCNTARKMASLIGDKNSDLSRSLVIEVGPGPGSITRYILERNCANLVVIEKDERMVPTLKHLASISGGAMKIIVGDILTVSHTEILKVAGISQEQAQNMPIHIFGNLPFSISTPLIVQWVHLLASRSGIFASARNVDLSLVFQKEVADRIVSIPNSSSRSRLSIMAQTYANARISMKLPSAVFVPKPKVDATMVTLTPRQTIPSILARNNVSSYALEDLLRIHFMHKRKIIRNTAIPYFNETFGASTEDIQQAYSEVGVDLGLRPDALTNVQWHNLAASCSSRGWLNSVPGAKAQRSLDNLNLGNLEDYLSPPELENKILGEMEVGSAGK